MTKALSFTEAQESHIQLENTYVSIVFTGMYDLSHKEKKDEYYNESFIRNKAYSDIHSHIYNELFVCVKDSIIIKTEDSYIRLDTGDAALIPIGLRHSLSDIIQNAEYGVVSFLCTPTNNHSHSELYKKLTPILNSAGILVFRQQTALVPMIQKITRCFGNKEKPACYPALQLLTVLIDLADAQSESDDSVLTMQNTPSAGFNDIHRINLLQQLIERNYMQTIRIDDFADKLHISIRQLARIVEKHYGKSLHRVIMDKRLETAENMLLYSNMTVEKIAISVGFNSKASFYREFTRKYQVTPVKYKEMKSEMMQPL